MKFVVSFIAMAALAGCGGKEEKAAPSAGSAEAVGSADTGSGSAAGSAAGSAEGSAAEAEPLDVPTKVDFEELAESEITDKNVEARVKEIEADLGE